MRILQQSSIEVFLLHLTFYKFLQRTWLLLRASSWPGFSYFHFVYYFLKPMGTEKILRPKPSLHLLPLAAQPTASDEIEEDFDITIHLFSLNYEFPEPYQAQGFWEEQQSIIIMATQGKEFVPEKILFHLNWDQRTKVKIWTGILKIQWVQMLTIFKKCIIQNKQANK